MHADARRAALLVTLLASFVTPFMASSVNIALPTIGREFGADAVRLGWVATAYILAAAALLLPFGRLADIRGRRRVFLWGSLAYAVASVACALAPSIGWLIALRAVQGGAVSTIFATSTALLTSVFPPGERGRVLGINVAAVYIGLSLGPSLGGVMTQHLGWRTLFLANLPLGLSIALLLAWRLRGEWAEARGESFDLVGTLVLAATLTLLMLGTPEVGRAGGWLLLPGAIGLVAFVLWERRARHPLLDPALFTESPVFAFSNLAALINYAATFAVTFLLSLYLQVVKALSPQAAGLILIAQPLVMAACSPFAGRLSDRVQPRTVASAGMGLTALGLALLTALGPATPLPAIMATLGLLGLGFGLFSSPNTNAVMGAVERRYYGVASATLGTMRLTGQMVSMGLASLVFALALGRVPIAAARPENVLQSLRAAFLLFTLLCGLGIFASLARGTVARGSARP
ncbi:MAG: MFS transporter [Candidatus Methylomirabilales bacterium]